MADFLVSQKADVKKFEHEGRLSGGLYALRLELVQEIDGALGMGGGGEDRAALVLQNFQPRGEVGGVVVADLRGEFEIGAQESGAQLGDEFLAGIAFVAPALASEITVKAGRMLYPVNIMPISA